jgi:hypothetical protein
MPAWGIATSVRSLAGHFFNVAEGELVLLYRPA